MSSRSRIVLLVVIIAIFAIVAPVLLLYALGYRFDRNTAEIRATGTIAVRFHPLAVRVSQDGDFIAEKRRFVKLDGLKPGSHTVRLEKDGYQPWEKTLEAREGQITWQENVILFANQPEMVQRSAKTVINAITNARADTTLWWEHDGEDFVLKEQTLVAPQATTLFSTKGLAADKTFSVAPHELLSWSGGSRYILFTATRSKQTHHYVIDRENSTVATEIEAVHPTLAFDQMAWSITAPEQILVLSHNRLFALNARTLALEPLIPAQEVLAFTPGRSGVALVLKQTDSTGQPSYQVATISGAGSTITPRGDALATNCEQFSLAWSRNNHLAILEECNGSVWIGDDHFSQLFTGMKQAVWASESRKGEDLLLVSSEHELAVWAEAYNTTAQLTRVSSSISSPVLSLNGSYVYYSTDRALRAIETDAFTGIPNQAVITSWTDEASDFTARLLPTENDQHIAAVVPSSDEKAAGMPQLDLITLYNE